MTNINNNGDRIIKGSCTMLTHTKGCDFNFVIMYLAVWVVVQHS